MEILVAILAFLAVAGVGVALTMSPQQEKSAKRARELVSAKPGRVKKDAAATAAAKRRQSVQVGLKALADTQKSKRKNLLSVKAQIAQANLTITETQFRLAQLAVAAVTWIIAMIAIGQSFWPYALALVLGGGGPAWVLKFLVNRRQKNFTNQLADAIDIIVRGIKSGLPLNQCLRIIASESPDPLRREFQLLVDGQAMGVDLDQNLQRLYERMPLPEVNFFSIVLVIQQRTGGNLSEALGNLSSVLRARKMLKEKVKALSSEAKASASIIGSLPFIVMGLVYMVRPAYMALLFTTPQGNLILLGAGVMMTTGILIMRSMVNFKF